MGDLADAATDLGRPLQEQQALNVRVGIAAAVCRGSHGLDGAIAFFPNPYDVRAQSRPEHDDLNGVSLINFQRGASPYTGSPIAETAKKGSSNSSQSLGKQLHLLSS